jgi:hypothetical protein
MCSQRVGIKDKLTTLQLLKGNDNFKKRAPVAQQDRAADF